MEFCYICFGATEEEIVCDTCGNHYCDNCSYSFTLHYQFQGPRCYKCSEQSRITPLKRDEVLENFFYMVENEKD